MADNYLERQRERYEERKAAWERQKKYGKKKPKLSSSTPASTSAEDKGQQPKPEE